jgi:hypothetical protein
MPGGYRPGAGRPKGSRSKSTADIKELLERVVDHEKLALNLVEIALSSESHQARVAATKEIWDRRYGKATQPISGDEDGPPVGLALKVHFVNPGE